MGIAGLELQYPAMGARTAKRNTLRLVSDDDSAIFLYSALHRFSGDDLFNMLCRVSKCTKQPFPFPLPGM